MLTVSLCNALIQQEVFQILNVTKLKFGHNIIAMFRTVRVFCPIRVWDDPYAYGMCVWADLQSHTRTGILYAYGAPYAYGTTRSFFETLKLFLRQDSSSTNDGLFKKFIDWLGCWIKWLIIS